MFTILDIIMTYICCCDIINKLVLKHKVPCILNSLNNINELDMSQTLFKHNGLYNKWVCCKFLGTIEVYLYPRFYGYR